MPLLEERVETLEEVFASYMQNTAAMLAEMREARRQADRRMEDSGRRMDEFGRRMDGYASRAEQDRKDFNRRMAEISDSVGTIIEDLVYPNAERIFGQIFPDDAAVSIFPRAKRRRAGHSMEIDLVAAGERHIMLVEARHRLNTEDARELQAKLLPFPQFYPEYANHRVVLVLASIAIEESLRTFLSRQKIYGLALGDETMELVNHGQF